MPRSRIRWGVLLYSCAALVLCTAAVSADPPVHLRLSFESTALLPATVRDQAVLEAARVWEPYGVIVDAGASTRCTVNEMPLSVAVDANAGASGESDNGLGAVRFDRDGMPESRATLHYNTIVKLAMSASVMDWQAERWPSTLRDQVVARAVGRALAHEIGHIVLRWPHHPSSGLMRGEFSASALADPNRSTFTLTATDQARLHIAVSAFLQSTSPDHAPPGALAMLAGHSSCAAS